MAEWRAVTLSNARHTRFGEIPAFVEGLHELDRRTYAWLVPNGSWGESNAGLVLGEGESLLVDTLWDEVYTGEMLEAMRPLTRAAPIQTVVNTHADGDHWWGNRLVAPAEIITSQASYEEMLTQRPGSLVLLGRAGSLLGRLGAFGADKVGRWLRNLTAPYRHAGITPALPTRTFEGKLDLEVGGRQVQLIEVGPAHTQGDLLVYVPDAKVLFSGDILFIDSTPVIWAGPVENWLAALDRILDMEVEVIVPGHGPLVDKAAVHRVKEYWVYVTAEVHKRYEAGMRAQEAAFDIALGGDFASQPFANRDSPERMMTNAHSLYRQWQGRQGHLGPLQMVDLLRRQALLAHRLPDALPHVMRSHA
ncbi:MAG: MBL fold metallo-hydrolase [Anaerolineae bacterium]|jgi:glyoxylase-like metal-dependent hydrolase (beta-lactamase superfamily II)